MKRTLSLWRSRLRDLFRRRRLAQDLDDELLFHLEKKTQALIDSGMNPEQARRAARLSFGNPTGARERMYELARLGLLEDLWQDLCYGARMLRQNRGFTAAAVLALALGIGVNTAIFTVVNALLLKPLPGIPDADRLVEVGQTRGSGSGPYLQPASYPTFLDLRRRATTLEGLALYDDAPLSLTRNGSAERVQGQLVSDNYFEVLGVKPALGRAFLPEENRTPGTHPVAVLSHALWQRLFDADRGVVGRTFTINARPFTVVGVAPRGFSGLEVGQPAALWLPFMTYPQAIPRLAASRLHEGRSSNAFKLCGRLKPGAAWQRASDEIRAIGAQLRREYPSAYGDDVAMGAVPHHGMYPWERQDAAEFLTLLLAAAGFVLAIACVNVANLLLSRAASRRRELSIRLAIGASRGRIVRQLLTESLLLSAMGGVTGLLLARQAAGWIEMAPPPFAWLPFTLDLAPDARVLGFTLALSLLASVLATLAPAFAASRPGLAGALKEGGLQQGRPHGRLRRVLVAAQVAICLVLLAGAGLLVRTMRNLHALDPGFDTRNVLVVSADPSLNGYPEPRQHELYTRLLERLRANPAVAAAALSSRSPLAGGSTSSTYIIDGKRRGMTCYVVTPGYFQSLRIPILAGRDFTARDGPGTPGVVIVNQRAAQRLWKGESAIGKRFQQYDGKWFEVVGVARDATLISLPGKPQSSFFFPLAQGHSGEMTLQVRAAQDAGALARLVRREMQELDPRVPLFGIRTLTQQADMRIWRERQAARLVSGFGLLALLLAVIGIYGVTAYAAGRRTQEIGVRMALGARGWQVLKLLVADGAAMILWGVAVGLGGALALTRLLASRLYGVRPTDPVTLAAAALLLVAVALAACYLPARRALRLDPVAALRVE